MQKTVIGNCSTAQVHSTSLRRIFWRYFVTINLFPMYLMNFVFNTMLDAASELVPRVHNKSMKCDASFSQGRVSMIFRWGGHFFHTGVKNFSPFTVQKIIKIHPVMLKNVLPPFYGSQCINFFTIFISFIHIYISITSHRCAPAYVLRLLCSRLIIMYNLP